ncbi:hypothetical protein [Acinetobacter baumannii]|uniref:hypothetical protein n=1 Tax=Acinetobacter baumannii TaxID=470 RepID=UPI0021C69C43|nr:hypothetical protein [Acinetobacter baumannii]
MDLIQFVGFFTLWKTDEDGSIAWDAFTWCHDCGSKGPSAWAMIAWDENFHYDTVYEKDQLLIMLFASGIHANKIFNLVRGVL